MSFPSKSTQLNQASPEKIINSPRLEMTLIDHRGFMIKNQKIILTPNSINGIIKISDQDKFFFGSNDDNTLSDSGGKSTNIDFNFNDKSMANLQFEIIYDKERNRFLVSDNIKGTGIFAKINKNMKVDRDLIISFCSCHMILQISEDSKIMNFL